jgi:nucleoside-diphosphate-sugar epimerase
MSRSGRSERSDRSRSTRSSGRALVTGSSGLLGSAIAGLLAQHGWSVAGVDRIPGPFTTIVADITTRGLFQSVLPGVDAVIHTASRHVPDLGRATEQNFLSVNVIATAQLLDAAIRNGVRTVVYSSTTSVYGRAMVHADRAVFVDETLQPVPRDIYDVTKLAAERLCREAAASNRHVTCLRVSRFFHEPPFTRLVHRLHRGVDVADAAEAHRLALMRSGRSFETFNVSAQTPFTEPEAELLARQADRVIARHFPDAPALLSRLGWSLPARIDRVYVIEKAARELGYRPRRNFRELLNELVAGETPNVGIEPCLRPCA